MTNPMIDSMWLQVTATAYGLAYSKGQEHMKYRYVDEIARSLLEHFPNSAHLYALERDNAIGELQTDMWRQVLTELDKLEAKNGRSVDEHNSRREEEQRKPRQDSSGEDGGHTWGQGSSSSVDESAP